MILQSKPAKYLQINVVPDKVTLSCLQAIAASQKLVWLLKILSFPEVVKMDFALASAN